MTEHNSTLWRSPSNPEIQNYSNETSEQKTESLNNSIERTLYQNPLNTNQSPTAKTDTTNDLNIETQINQLLKVPIGISEEQLSTYAKQITPKAIKLFDSIIKNNNFAKLAELYMDAMNNPSTHRFRKINALIKELKEFWNKVALQEDDYLPYPDARVFVPDLISRFITSDYEFCGLQPPQARHPFDMIMGYYFFTKAKPLCDQVMELRCAIYHLRAQKFNNAYKNLNKFLNLKPNKLVQEVVSTVKKLINQDQPNELNEQRIDITGKNEPDFIKNLIDALENLQAELEVEPRHLLKQGLIFKDYASMEELFLLDTYKLDHANATNTPLSPNELNEILENTDQNGIHLTSEFLFKALVCHEIANYYQKFYTAKVNYTASFLNQRSVRSKSEIAQKRNQYLRSALYYSQLGLTLRLEFIPKWFNAHNDALNIGTLNRLYPECKTIEDVCELLIKNARSYLSESDIQGQIERGKEDGHATLNPREKLPGLVQKKSANNISYTMKR